MSYDPNIGYTFSLFGTTADLSVMVKDGSGTTLNLNNTAAVMISRVDNNLPFFQDGTRFLVSLTPMSSAVPVVPATAKFSLVLPWKGTKVQSKLKLLATKSTSIKYNLSSNGTVLTITGSINISEAIIFGIGDLLMGDLDGDGLVDANDLALALGNAASPESFAQILSGWSTKKKEKK